MFVKTFPFILVKTIFSSVNIVYRLYFSSRKPERTTINWEEVIHKPPYCFVPIRWQIFYPCKISSRNIFLNLTTPLFVTHSEAINKKHQVCYAGFVIVNVCRLQDQPITPKLGDLLIISHSFWKERFVFAVVLLLEFNLSQYGSNN